MPKRLCESGLACSSGGNDGTTGGWTTGSIFFHGRPGRAGTRTHTGHKRETQARSRSRSIAISARRTTTGPVETHRRRTRAHGSHRRTSQPSEFTNTHKYPHVSATAETAADSTAAGRRPGADRSPRSTQKRPPPANPTLPPPAYLLIINYWYRSGLRQQRYIRILGFLVRCCYELVIFWKKVQDRFKHTVRLPPSSLRAGAGTGEALWERSAPGLHVLRGCG